MKKIVLLVLAVLLVWNLILTFKIAQKDDDPSYNINETTVDGFSTDLTIAAADVQSMIVKVNTEKGFGSGVIVVTDEKNVYIATNYHVIEGASNIEVILDDFAIYKAELVGYDVKKDVAVLHFTPEYTIEAIAYGDASLLDEGEFVLAIGVSDDEFAKTISLGIVSSNNHQVEVNDASGHYYQAMIQSDANLKEGMSGGALINMSGELVGLNTMSADGLALAISVNELRLIVNDIIISNAASYLDLGIKAYPLAEMTNYQKLALGFDLQTVSGIYVDEVLSDSIGEKIGLLKGDLITNIGGVNIIDQNRYLEALYNSTGNIVITIQRDGSALELLVNVND